MKNIILRFVFSSAVVALPLFSQQQLPLGQVVVTHVFDGPNDSPDPQFGLIELANGNFAGITQGTGHNNPGSRMIYEMTPDGTVTPLIKFGRKVSQLRNSLDQGFEGSFSLLQASDGNFYGTTTNGGATGQGNLYRMTPAGVYSVLFAFGYPPLGGLAESLDGGLYGIGNQNRINDVYRVDLASGNVEIVATASGYGAIGTPVFSDAQSFYTLYEQLANQLQVAVGSFNTSTLASTIVGTFSNQQIPEGYFSDPVVLRPHGSIWFTQPGYSCPAVCGSIAEEIGGNGSVAYTFLSQNGIVNPVSLISATDGNLYGVTFNYYLIGNQIAEQVFQFNPTSGSLTTYQLPAAAGVGSNGPLLQDSNGYLRGTSGQGAGSGNPGAAFALNLGLPKPLPSILGFAPTSGTPGTTVKVLGSYLVNANSVTLAGQPVVFINPTAGAVFFTVPVGSKTGSIVITTAAGSGTGGGTFQVE